MGAKSQTASTHQTSSLPGQESSLHPLLEPQSSRRTMPAGAYTLIVTPFDRQGRLDEQGLRTLVRRQVEAGIHGISPLGVTGEIYSLSEREIEKVVEIVVEEAKDRCLVVPEIASNNMDVAVARARLYADTGCDYAVAFTPFLASPPQRAIIEFYRRLADKSPIPIVLHNSKGRTGIDMTPETIATLAEHENIVGIKEGSLNAQHVSKVIHLTLDADFSVYSAKDTTALPYLCMGGSGVFTVSGNIIPEEMASLVEYFLKGEYSRAWRIHHRYFELFEALRFETNPMAVKEAMRMLGLPAGYVRPPLTDLKEEYRRLLEERLRRAGLL